MNRKDREKAIELGRELIKKADFDKRAFLEANTALLPEEAAKILGCRVRDLSAELPPSFFHKSRPKWIQADVIKHRDAKKRATEKQRLRNREMLQEA
jgi:hypothetical protein